MQKDIQDLKRTQRATTMWVKGLSGLTYEARLNALKLPSLEKRRRRDDLVLTHIILYNQINLEVNELFKFSENHHLDCSIKLGEPEEGGTVCMLSCRALEPLALAVSAVPDQRA